MKFISYDGSWPNLCSGTLRIEHNDRDYKLDYVLVSGGTVTCDESWNYEIENGPWSIYPFRLPDELQHPDLIQELTRLANEHIEWGCCGGCT